MKIDELKDKKILILGFGKEGRDTLKFLKKIFPKKVIGIADQKQFPISNFQFPNVKLNFGNNYLKALRNYDVIIKSPGIPIHLPEIEKAFKEGKITSQTEIFFENCPGKIIGITGTKGKGTTASLVYQILKKGGIKVHLIGNIGRPVLSTLFSASANDVYIYELSSHQLYNLKKSPQIAVFLNIYPDHLDYYKNFKEYVNAKANIGRYQTKNDYLIYNSSDEVVKEIVKKFKARKIPIPTDKLNTRAAIEVGKILKIKKEIIKKTIKNFKPLLSHRLEYVGTFQKIKFYNDSAATIPEATIFALDTLGNNVQTILLGGSDKKVSFKNLAKRILRSKIKNIIFFPPTGEKIWKEILREAKDKEAPQYFFVNSNMKDAVTLAYQHTEKGKICLLSPASASFGLFQDYKERGNLFKKYVRLYAKNH